MCNLFFLLDYFASERHKAFVRLKSRAFNTTTMCSSSTSNMVMEEKLSTVPLTSAPSVLLK